MSHSVRGCGPSGTAGLVVPAGVAVLGHELPVDPAGRVPLLGRDVLVGVADRPDTTMRVNVCPFYEVQSKALIGQKLIPIRSRPKVLVLPPDDKAD